MKKIVKNYTRDVLETNYITCIWIIRILVITNGIAIYNWLF